MAFWLSTAGSYHIKLFGQRFGMTLPRKKSFRPPSVLSQPNTPQYHAEIRRPPDAVALCRAGESLIFRLRQAEIYLLLPKVLSVFHNDSPPYFLFRLVYIFYSVSFYSVLLDAENQRT